MPLTYAPFIAIESIQKAVKNAPPLKLGSKGIGVKMLQGGLMDLGYKIPNSTKKTGYPDGIYGDETVKVVTQFQKDYKLPLKDGIAGKNTIASLDILLKKKAYIPPKPPKPLIPVSPKDKDYTIGNSDPKINPDKGAGIFNSKPTQVSLWALKQAILEILPPRGSSVAIFIGIDASKHMLHYLSAKGSKRPIDLEGMIEASPTAKAHFTHEVSQAQRFVEKLAVGTHQITSKTAESAYNYKSETKNWFYAVGGYSTWGKGVVTVNKDGSGQLIYSLKFEYHFYDRYNWDKGKEVTIGSITVTDEFMGDFHRQGLAREYDEVAVIKRQFSWKQGQVIPSEQYNRTSGR